MSPRRSEGFQLRRAARPRRWGAIASDARGLRRDLIDFNGYNLNLRTMHDQIYPSTFDGVTVTFLISSTIGSTSLAASHPLFVRPSARAAFIQ
ncbi:hypothetical protein CP49_41145 [Bradyrhizobium valentinum]|uniref:Uncharacterized protein n=1 Tax=Bradyrhizobium valentinum TaxID=1518501 RepID=A0A0R3L7M2_9BRAD|nr:hypothetical protein CP49_41145 [Bradyrhizobium valentinum]